jgi:Tol biopolymer transport system component
VPVDGSAPARRVDLPLVPGGSVQYYALDLDGSHLVYLADQEEDERFELFTVPTDASAPPSKLNDALVTGGDVGEFLHGQFFPSFLLSFDGRWVTYTADQETDGRFELYSAPSDGSRAAVKLSTAADAKVTQGGHSYDSAWVVYGSDPSGTDAQELSSVPIDGSAPARALTGPMVPGGDAFTLSQPWPLATYLEFPPKDFGRIVFLRDGEMLTVGVVPGAKPVPLDALPGDQYVGDVSSFQLTPDGTRALYTAREANDAASDLYSVSTGERRLDFQLHPEGTQASLPVLSPDGTRALFTQSGSAVPAGLYVAAVDGSTPPILLSTRSTSERSFSPDGTRAFFLASEAGDTHLFSVPSDGSAAPVRLSVGLPVGSSVSTGARSSADGLSVAFLSSTDQLHVAPTDGTLANVRVSATGQRVLTDFELTPDGSFAVYRVSAGPRIHLFAASRDGSAPPLRLNSQTHANIQVSSFVMSPDGTRAYFQADQDVDGQEELYAVPLDASQPPLALSDPLAPGQVVRSFALSPDGSRLVFLAAIPAGGIPRLFSVPSDGSATRIRLGEGVLDFRITPDSRRVVFRSGGVLLSTRIAGARAPLVVGRAPFAGGGVFDYRISADSSTVAFRATRNAAGRLTLLAGPVDGGQKAVELAGPFAGNGTVIDFALSADGRLGAWRSDQEVVDVFQLYAAPTGRVKSLRRP